MIVGHESIASTEESASNRDAPVRVVLFSGGRGSGVLAKRLITHPDVRLTLAINGYDDGASTGEVRRFLGDALGPSDFRKNAARLATELRSCPRDLLVFLERRLPVGCTRADAAAILDEPRRRGASGETWDAVYARLRLFERELDAGARTFEFSDCSIGNLVFAGSFLHAGRRFNAAVDDYCALVGLRRGLVQNVTDGTNAFLVALDRQGRLLGSEEEIVDATRRNEIDDLFLIDPALSADERERWTRDDAAALRGRLNGRSVRVRLNDAIVDEIAAADVIVYAPGTQHSSLFPSYLTPGLSAAIAANLKAIKLLITNIQVDAEIPTSSAVDLVDRALYYLKDRGRLALPAPALITHYLLNDPAADSGAPYVPLGRLDRLEDPRLVRIGNYEDAGTGRHDAARVLAPFVDSLLTRRDRPRVAVLLHHHDSLDKAAQTMVEIVRGGIDAVPVALTVFYSHGEDLDRAFCAALPFAVRNLRAAPERLGETFRHVLSGAAPESGAGAAATRAHEPPFEYVLLFESSGMYRGEDIVSLVSHLRFVNLDAVWGSRRLSVREIAESYRLRYEHKAWLGTVSYLGSHLLSVAYLLLYGRYMSDTLSAAFALRPGYLLEPGVDPLAKGANHALLTALLRDRAEILETPVQFFPLSPDKVRRTTILDGLRALGTILLGRFKRRPSPPGAKAGAPAPVGHDADAHARHAGS